MKKIFPWLLIFAMLLAVGYGMSQGGSPAARSNRPGENDEIGPVKISLSESLKEYMVEEGHKDIVVAVATCMT